MRFELQGTLVWITVADSRANALRTIITSGNLLNQHSLLYAQLGDDPTKEDVKTFTEKTLSSGKVRAHAAAPRHPVSSLVVPGDEGAWCHQNQVLPIGRH